MSFENASLVPNQNCCGGNLVTDGSGIVLDDFQNSQETGNGIDYDRRTLVENNILYDNGGQGIHVFRSHLIDIRNNTAVNNSLVLGSPGQINLQTSRDINVYNNIASAGPGENSVRSSGGSTRITLENNILDGPVVSLNSSGNILADPGFRTGTFELQADSPAVNAGLAIDDPFSIDALGQDRTVGQIDIGAVERQ